MQNIENDINIDYNKLLNRKPISTDLNKISSYVKGKRILITGGVGSIGSEIVRQLCELEAALIIIYDNAETPLFYLKKEISEKYPNSYLKYFIGDVRDIDRLNEEINSKGLDYCPFVINGRLYFTSNRSEIKNHYGNMLTVEELIKEFNKIANGKSRLYYISEFNPLSR